MSGGAEADQAQHLARRQVGFAQRPVADDPGAQKRHGAVIGDRLRQAGGGLGRATTLSAHPPSTCRPGEAGPAGAGAYRLAGSWRHSEATVQPGHPGAVAAPSPALTFGPDARPPYRPSDAREQWGMPAGDISPSIVCRSGALAAGTHTQAQLASSGSGCRRLAHCRGGILAGAGVELRGWRMSGESAGAAIGRPRPTLLLAARLSGDEIFGLLAGDIVLELLGRRLHEVG